MNLPNKITLIRIAFIPVFMLVLLWPQDGWVGWNTFIAMLIFILASITDGIDGYLARKHGLITNLGKFLDPLADKLLMAAAFICLVEIGRVEAWVAVLILTREFAITGLRGIAADEGLVIAASVLGKIKTVTQIVAVSALLCTDFFNLFLPVWFGYWLAQIALYVAVFYTVYSGIDYIIKCKAVFTKNM